MFLQVTYTGTDNHFAIDNTPTHTAYAQFNGLTHNYNGTGRDAADNNTLFLLAWLAY